MQTVYVLKVHFYSLAQNYRLASFLSRRIGGVTQVFACGEDTLALRLTSKLVDLRSGYVNWCALAHPVRIASDAPKGKENRTSDDVLFSFGGVTQI